MARKIAEPKRAFKSIVSERIENVIERLFQRSKRTLSVPKVTYKEMLNLIAPEDHHDVLMRARGICSLGFGGGINESAPINIIKHRGVDVSVEFQLNTRTGPVMPNHTLWLNHFPINSDLALRLEKAACEYADVSINWGMVKMVFKYLNKHCQTAQQMRYLWPSVLGLMSLDDDLDDIRAELTPNPVPRNLPSLPLTVRNAMRYASATVAMALLLPPLENDAVAVKDVGVRFMAADSGGICVDRLSDGQGLWLYPMN